MAEPPAVVSAAMLKRLPAVLRERRAAGALTYDQVAAQTGIAKSALHGLEHGRKDVRISTAIRLLAWINRSTPSVNTWAVAELTGAARQVHALLIEHQGLGQAWLRIEQNGYGLVLPDLADTLGMLIRRRGLTWATWGELEGAGFAEHGIPDRMPPHLGPRNRRRPDTGYPIRLSMQTEPPIERTAV